MNANALNIEVSCDTTEATEFCGWLVSNGHSASVGNTTENRINGVSTSIDSDANDTMRALWDKYCAA